MKIVVFLDLVPQEYLEIKKTTIIRSIKKYLEKYNNIERIQFFVNDKTESKILNSDKYNKYNLSSIWKDLNNPAIYLYTPNPFKYTSKDMVFKIMDEMDDFTLLNFCKINNQRDSEGVLYCNNEKFWENRFIQKYGEVDKNQDRTWKDLYLNILYYNENKRKLWKLYKNNKNLDLIDFFTKNYKDSYKLKINIYNSIIANNKNLINFFIFQGFNDWNYGLELATLKGDKDLIKFFISQGANNWNRGLIEATAKGDKELNNDIKIIKKEDIISLIEKTPFYTKIFQNIKN